MALNWTKTWASSDDGSLFTGANLRTLQDDISQQCVYLLGAPLTNGILLWDGTNYTSALVLPSQVSVSASQLVDIVFSDDEVISCDNELVYSN